MAMDVVPTAFFESHDGGCTRGAVAASAVSKETCGWQACQDIHSDLLLSYICVFLKGNLNLTSPIVKDRLLISIQ